MLKSDNVRLSWDLRFAASNLHEGLIDNKTTQPLTPAKLVKDARSLGKSKFRVLKMF
jgi:hypothetical protein